MTSRRHHESRVSVLGQKLPQSGHRFGLSHIRQRRADVGHLFVFLLVEALALNFETLETLKPALLQYHLLSFAQPAQNFRLRTIGDSCLNCDLSLPILGLRVWNFH